MAKSIHAPLSDEAVSGLRAGEEVLISGFIYAARDAAHKRMMRCLDEGIPLPFEMAGQVIYYVGPCPARPGKVIGSAGPTTSGRMDAYAPRLLDLGLKGMIGKGMRNEAVISSMIRNGAVYFGAIGGAAALIARCVIEEEIIAYPDLGTEAVRRLLVRDLPAFVVIDSRGGNFYESGRASAAEKLRIYQV
jgi:fumarate hydratase subunit beta